MGNLRGTMFLHVEQAARSYIPVVQLIGFVTAADPPPQKIPSKRHSCGIPTALMEQACLKGTVLGSTAVVVDIFVFLCSYGFVALLQFVLSVIFRSPMPFVELVFLC